MRVTYRTIWGRPEDVRAFFGDVLRTSSGRNFAQWGNTSFHPKPLCQKPMLRQVDLGVQNGPITKNRVLAKTNLFFRKFCFSLRIDLISLSLSLSHHKCLSLDH